MVNNFNVSSAPHIRDENTTMDIMLDVIIALIPAMAFGVYTFGTHALMIIIATVITCVLSEFLFNIVTKRKNSIGDLSAVVTGIILALNMPPTVELYIPILGSIFAIVVVKMLFGGLGQNFMNPALAARAFLAISFASSMNTFVYDGVTEATPLILLKSEKQVDLLKMFIGFIPGTIGEVSALAILIGATYLLIKKIIDYKLPLATLVSFVLFLLIFSGKGSNANYVLGQVLGGGLLFGVFFMATDYVTSPVTDFGKVLYGIFLGILIGIFRVFGKSSEGVSFCILIGNLFVPFIERITIPRPFGKGGR